MQILNKYPVYVSLIVSFVNLTRLPLGSNKIEIKNVRGRTTTYKYPFTIFLSKRFTTFPSICNCSFIIHHYLFFLNISSKKFIPFFRIVPLIISRMESPTDGSLPLLLNMSFFNELYADSQHNRSH